MKKTGVGAKETSQHPAFALRTMTGKAMEIWRNSESLIGHDALFALGFTSYQAFLGDIKKHQNESIESVREILIRLYMLEPEHARMFVPPSIQQLLDFLFNLKPNASEEERKRCIALLAPILGRNRGSGYRWLRNEGNSVSLPIRKLSAKVFSMNPEFAREYFWRAALITAKARNLNTEIVEERLAKNGVKLG